MKKIQKNNTQEQFIKNYFDEIKHCLDSLDNKKIELATDMVLSAYKNDRKVFILGNGGSASTASHMTCDLGKGTLQRIYDNSERRLKVISLTDNMAVITAYGNDLGFEDIFVQQLRNLVETDDVVIVISGSGNSKNIIKTLNYAKECGAKTIGFLGFKTGGQAAGLVDCAVIVDSNFYGPIEDMHNILSHVIASWISKIKNFHDGNESLTNENKAVPFR